MKTVVKRAQVNICLLLILFKMVWKKAFLSTFVFGFAVEYAIVQVQEIQKGFELNGTHKILVYADNTKLLGEKCECNKNTEPFLLDTGKKAPPGRRNKETCAIRRQKTSQYECS